MLPSPGIIPTSGATQPWCRNKPEASSTGSKREEPHPADRHIGIPMQLQPGSAHVTQLDNTARWLTGTPGGLNVWHPHSYGSMSGGTERITCTAISAWLWYRIQTILPASTPFNHVSVVVGLGFAASQTRRLRVLTGDNMSTFLHPGTLVRVRRPHVCSAQRALRSTTQPSGTLASFIPVAVDSGSAPPAAV